MKYYIFTLGCQMNVSDSQRIAQKLEDIGYESASEQGADLVIVNACSVRQKAVDRIWGKIKKWQNDGKKVLITGCVLPTDKKKFAQKNIKFFNIKDLPILENILGKNCHTTQYDSFAYFLIKLKMSPSVQSTSQRVAYVPIMTGCDNFCSYCAVPYTRGKEISRPMEDILADVRTAISDGYKDILLLGQNVNSYKCKNQNAKIKMTNKNSNLIENQDFIKLLKKIDNISSDFIFNFITSNPHDMSDELIDTFAKLKKWPRELHLPLQSGDDGILKKMNRNYSSKKYLYFINKLRNAISNLQISTDIIVGFPGETKEQFENTVKLCKKIKFSKAYIAQYSLRPGTTAAKFKDNVSREEKKRRWQILNQLIN